VTGCLRSSAALHQRKDGRPDFHRADTVVANVGDALIDVDE